MTQRRFQIPLVLAVILLGSAFLRGGTVGRPDLDQFKTPIYTIDGPALLRHNGDRYANRPLYCNQTAGAVLGGDLPYLMVGGGNVRNAVFMIALQRNGSAKWAQFASDITMRFTPDRIDWTIRDQSWGATAITLTAVPTAEGVGMAMRASIDSPQAGDKIIWLCGAAVREHETFLNHYDLTTIGREGMLKRGFTPADCSGDEVAIDNGICTITAPSGKSKSIAKCACSEHGELKASDASEWNDPVKLMSAAAKDLPVAMDSVDAGAEIYLSIRAAATPVDPQPKEDFLAGVKRVEQIANQVKIDTPDAWLNAAVPISSAVMDGVFRDGMYTHSGMRWGVPLLGWRTTFGPTAYGWHDRVMIEAKKCIASQVTESDKTVPVADPKVLLAAQAPSSRMFGVGRIELYQPHHYDMQSQFFDQLLYAWRSTGDPDLEKLLKPSLDLHLNYIRDCFDPSHLGIYESYANTWPTDDQWYNGGGTSEETAYAYRGEHDAMLIAQRAGDDASAKRHEAAMEKIREAFFDLLWDKAQGHPGAYREQGGLKRLHSSAWLYAIFCPIDAGLLDQQQSAEALHYTEWGLERMKMPYGGEQCWPSNWVPSIWSLREMWPGDNYHLALAYYQTGLPDDGWSLLHGTFPQQMFFGPVPGDLGHPAGGTDFNDCASMFCRTVVEGLFGYSPDYPNHQVTFTPGFPAEWDHASISTPDMSEKFSRQGNTINLAVTVAKPADLILRIPVSTTAVQKVTCNGKEIAFDVLPSFDRSLVTLTIPHASAAVVQVVTADALGTFPPAQLAVNSGDKVQLKTDQGKINSVADPEGAIEPDNRWSHNAGDHLVFAETQVGSTRQWRLFKVRITDVAAEQAVEAKQVKEIPKDAHWSTIDLTGVFNGEVRTIYQQKYLSPRPNTCSLRLATDGYSTWQMMLDPKNRLPAIDFSKVDSLLNDRRQVVSSEGVPFAWTGGEKNIAFTSQWDNWPKQIDVPVKRGGEAVMFLLCGTTNPMEVRIANASLRLTYSDGAAENIDIVPPFNFWSLCPLQKSDYDYRRDVFALPAKPPMQMQLGENCRAIVLPWRLRAGVKLDHVSLLALSQQPVIGLMGLTIMNPNG